MSHKSVRSVLRAGTPRKFIYEDTTWSPGDGMWRRIRSPPELDLLEPQKDNDDENSEVGVDDLPTWEDPSFTSDDDVDVHENAVPPASYHSVVGPAYIRNDLDRFADGEVPIASGLAVKRVLLVPSDVDHPRAKMIVRFPEGILEEKITLVSGASIGTMPRIVIPPVATMALIDRVTGRAVMPPCDPNDVWCRFRVATGDQDIIQLDEKICTEDCKAGGLWKAAEASQSRFCQTCVQFFHVGCMTEKMVMPGALKDHADHLAEYGQEYLRPLCTRDSPPSIVKVPSLIINGDSADIDADVHDTKNLVEMPKTTYAEVACLPIRRRTYPGRTPLTNEVLIQYAIQQVQEGRGDNRVEKLYDVLVSSGLCPHASVRGAKTILWKDLRKHRGQVMWWFLCPGCSKRLI
ncbi:hypothetical protein EV122DRAFT_295560 [Schizophyllum commune]